ncbi:Uncharacterised protein [Mycobacterium tuberculosis]|nr:Uncharacterised protein [Mycobacterium tuberculosis]
MTVWLSVKNQDVVKLVEDSNSVNVNIRRIKKWQEQHIKNYWMQVFTLVTLLVSGIRKWLSTFSWNAMVSTLST